MISVILCGGAGSRLWPLSRELYPKPFIRLSDGQSFIKKTFIKAASLPWTESIYVVANRRLYFKLAEEYAASGVELEPAFILEPFGRNTAPAIASAALLAKDTYGPEAPLLILPSDHLITNQAAFAKLVERALTLAEAGRLVTFGIRPTRPETGFGYMEAAGETVLRFVEKPDAVTAEKYVAAGNFLWNAGIFCFQAEVLLEEMAKHAPEVLQAVKACLKASKDLCDQQLDLDEPAFAQIPSISIDYAVFEKSQKVSVVSGEDIGWSDIGSWTELCSLRPQDEAGNHLSHPENVVLEDARGCLIDNPKNLVAALGVRDLLIVDTEDALLVADKARAQDVRIIYERLKTENRLEALHHPTVFKPWGFYKLMEEGERFKTKVLALKPGACISLQLHHHRSEHWIVVSGMAEVTCGDEVFFVNTNESTYIKAGIKHRVSNPGTIQLVLIEVQSGDYLGEDDIVRFDDVYGRIEEKKPCA